MQHLIEVLARGQKFCVRMDSNAEVKVGAATLTKVVLVLNF